MATSGLLPASSLSVVTGTARVIRSDLVQQTNALRAKFAASLGKPLVVTDGYRTYQSQVNVFTSRYTTVYLAGRPYRVWEGVRWYQRPGTAPAAVPGTSNHGWGQAIDFGSGVNASLYSPEYLWMRNNAPVYGWTHPLWARQSGTLEPWHWEAVYVPWSNYAPGPGPGPDPIPPIYPIPPEVPDMDANDKAVAQQTLDAAVGAHGEAKSANIAATTGLEVTRSVLGLIAQVQAGAITKTELKTAVARLEADIDAAESAIRRDVRDVKDRMPLATRKQYQGLVAERASYTALESQYGSYEDMAGVRDPLAATVEVEISDETIKDAVESALVDAAPVIIKGVNDDAADRRKAWK